VTDHVPKQIRFAVRRMLKARSISRFFVVGIVNTLVGITVFPILYWLFIGYAGINSLLAVSYVLCTLSAFGLHKTVTFESRGRTHVEGPKFFLLSAFTFMLNFALLNGLLYAVPVHPVILQTAIAILLQVGNYLIMNRLIFVTAGSPAKPRAKEKRP
jgi:putative flippase GtrA